MFCQNCGAQMGGAFCNSCGARASQTPPPPPPPPPAQYTPTPPQYAPPQYAQPPYTQPLAPPAKSGSGLKILLVVLGIFLLLGMVAVGGIMYAVHRAKQAIASTTGVDLNSFSEQRHGPARRLDACALLTKDDLSQILNLPVDRAEGTGLSTHSTCKYYSAAAQQRGSDEAAAAVKKLQESGKSGDSNANTEQQLANLGNMIRGITSAAAGAGDEAILSIETESDNAKAAMAGFKLGMGVATIGMGKDADPAAKAAIRQDVSGVGDEAMFGPLLSLFMFRQGDVSVQLDGRTLPGGRDAQIAIAKHIASKL
jgi:hypothetical protein